MTKMTRRRFVSESVEGAAAVALGTAVLGVPRPVQAGSPHNKVVLALMGAGGRGMDLAQKMLAIPDVQFKYVCDVYDVKGRAGVAALEKIQGVKPKLVGDIRQVLDDKDVHAVVVATPEHWHALATIWACQAGKDVYVEKNISLFVWEGRKMLEAARKYQRIVQAGFQNRSAPDGRSARQYIKQGGLGTVMYAKVFSMLGSAVGGYPRHRGADQAPPPGLDWDRWLGPAPERPYNTDASAAGTATGTTRAAALQTRSTSWTWRGWPWTTRRTPRR